jgi:hypothetical protein
VASTKEETPSTNKCKGCYRKGNTEEDYWKFQLEKHPKHFQKKKKKKTMLPMDVEERVENTSYLEGNISLTNLQNEVELVGCNDREEKEMAERFCIRIHMKQSKVDWLFDPCSQSNLISTQLVDKFWL